MGSASRAPLFCGLAMRRPLVRIGCNLYERDATVFATCFEPVRVLLRNWARPRKPLKQSSFSRQPVPWAMDREFFQAPGSLALPAPGQAPLRWSRCAHWTDAWEASAAWASKLSARTWSAALESHAPCLLGVLGHELLQIGLRRLVLPVRVAGSLDRQSPAAPIDWTWTYQRP